MHRKRSAKTSVPQREALDVHPGPRQRPHPRQAGMSRRPGREPRSRNFEVTPLPTQRRPRPHSRHQIPRLAGWLLAGLLLVGCQTPPRQPTPPSVPPTDGWTFTRGQVVWRANDAAPEIAGELVLATHPAGFVTVEFAKPPVSIVSASRTPQGWSLSSAARHRIHRGRGQPPAKIGWLALAACLAGQPVAEGWTFRPSGGVTFQMIHARSGETFEGYLAP